MAEIPRDPDSVLIDGFDTALEMVRTLIASRTLVKDRLEDDMIIGAFKKIGEVAQVGGKRDRLNALSVLGKAAEISKPLAVLVRPLLKSALSSPVPRTGDWGDADDRYYLAKAVASCDESWVPEYAAVELAQGDVAEKKSREVWAEVAIHRSSDLASAVKAVERAFSEDRATSAYSSDTACRKLNRILAALVNPLSLADLPLGDGFGQSFSDLILTGGGTRGPETRSLREETAAAVLNVMAQLLRLRFSASMDARVYRAAGTVLGWWRPARPSEEIDQIAFRIISIAMDALHVLARQGVSERVVRQALVNAFGQSRVDVCGVSISQRDPSLDPYISAWLATGRDAAKPQLNDAVRDINEQELDEILAKLLLAVARQDSSRNLLDMMADDLEILEPAHATTIRTSSARARLVTQWANAAASKRRLKLFGDLGELVAYDPAVHVADNTLQISARARVRISGVVKELEGRPTSIIVKAQVERADGHELE